MASASSSLRTGWITFWIALGVIALVIFVALPIAVTHKAGMEYARFQACQRGLQTSDCKPSIAWYLNGWTLGDATSTRSSNLMINN